MSKSVSNGGISTLSLLGIVFVVLKLTKVITWSWFWVTAPFWGGIAIIGIFVFLLMLIALFRG